jgi:hypothetical protein
MTAVLKLAAGAVLLAGLVVERGALVPAPGFALVAGVLLAAYLWFLAKARPYIRPRS